MKLYVGNLAYSTTEDELKQIFSEFGTVDSVTVIKDRFTGQSKGFGFVEMPKNAEADTAIKSLNDRMVGGRKLKVNQAQPQRDRPSGGRGGGGAPAHRVCDRPRRTTLGGGDHQLQRPAGRECEARQCRPSP